MSDEKFNPNDPTIPTVGQRFDLWHAYPTVIGNCKCSTAKGVVSLIVLTQLNNITNCANCGWGYRIIGIGPGGIPVVGMIPPAASRVM